MRGHLYGGLGPEVFACLGREEQSLQFVAQLHVAGAGGVEEGAAPARLQVERGGIELLDPLPAFRRHSARPGPAAGPVSSRRSQCLARRQSRKTVGSDTSSTSAVSSTLSPPKMRSSTTLAFLGSAS